MSRFEQILNSPGPPAEVSPPRGASKGTVSGAVGAANNAVSSAKVMDQETLDKYWQSVLTNAYFLRYPAGEGKFEPLRPLYDVLNKLKSLGAGLAIVEEKVGRRGRVMRLKLEQSTISNEDWKRIRAEELPGYREQLRWLFTLSVMGAAAEYVDLGVDFPREWIEDNLGKHGARIADLRREVLEEMVERMVRGKSGRVCFEVDGEASGAGDSDSDGARVVSGEDKGYKKVYCLVPGKTGCREIGGRAVVELTPEEVVLVAEAQAAGMLAPGPEGALSALKWAG